MWVSPELGEKYQIKFSNEDSAEFTHSEEIYMSERLRDANRFYVETWSVVQSSRQAREHMVSAS